MLSSLDPAGWHDGPPGAAVLPQAAAALVLPQGPAVPDHQAAAPGTGHTASGHVDNVRLILLIKSHAVAVGVKHTTHVSICPSAVPT